MKKLIVLWVTVILVFIVSFAYLPTPANPTETHSRVNQGGSRIADHVASRITRVTSPQVAEPAPGTWSNCLVVNGVAYISGMVARGNDGKVVVGDEYEQAKLSFAKIRNLVEAAGGTMADVVKITIFVTDIKQREKVWRARREFFAGDFPASTLVQVAALAEPSVKVEIEAIAYIGAGKR
ncbi:MAG TPA: RidA family protein [Candidatus Acidoferrales bacterium]|nr:RidA family protein [Candidatus Acidoferrales bacterium]